ncbi:flavodoxin I [Peribacillus simplex]|uniref:Flavodoxin n=1 Tax=Peribacillus simplex TaxID=1478 RepID=A0A9X8RBB9_9BACI|nr:flavodoxin [Peribacillus simplex]SIR73546.1 flavodoxin I [Peribacillus simplex]
MSKIIIIFASMSGNTEEMANAIAEGITEISDVNIEKIDIMDGPEASILGDYDGILLGAYTWGDGELPDDYLDFYEELDHIDLTGKKAAVFGSCDSSYTQYGAAVDILNEKLREKGAVIVLEGLKVELTPDDEDIKNCQNFGGDFIKKSFVPSIKN